MNALETRTISLANFDTNTDHLNAEEIAQVTTAELIEDEANEIAWDMMAELSAGELMSYLEAMGFDIMSESPRFRSEDDMDRWIDNQMDWMTEELTHTVTITDGQVEISIGVE